MIDQKDVSFSSSRTKPKPPPPPPLPDLSPTARNTTTFAVDTDDIKHIPDICSTLPQTKIPSIDSEIYSQPYNEHEYEQPQTTAPPARSEKDRLCKQSETRASRSRTNNAYSSSYDDVSKLNGRPLTEYSGYSYVRNTDRVNDLGYDNPVKATEYELDDSYKPQRTDSTGSGERFRENTLYGNGSSGSTTLTLKGVRHISSKRKRCACLGRIAIMFWILVSTGAAIVACHAWIRTNQAVKDLHRPTGKTQEYRAGQQEPEDKTPDQPRNFTTAETKLKREQGLLKEQVSSMMRNYSTLLEKYNKLQKQVENDRRVSKNTNSSIWDKLAKLRGPRGYNGTQGRTGPQGSQGPAGPRGPRGLSISDCRNGNKTDSNKDPHIRVWTRNSKTEAYYSVSCWGSRDGHFNSTFEPPRTWACKCSNDDVKKIITCVMRYIVCKVVPLEN